MASRSDLPAAGWGPRLLRVRRRFAAGLLLLTCVGYPLAWQADPYIFGVFVLALMPLQISLALIGVLVRVARVDPVRGPLVWLVDGLLVACLGAALAFTRTISWA